MIVSSLISSAVDIYINLQFIDRVEDAISRVYHRSWML